MMTMKTMNDSDPPSLGSLLAEMQINSILCSQKSTSIILEKVMLELWRNTEKLIACQATELKTGLWTLFLSSF